MRAPALVLLLIWPARALAARAGLTRERAARRAERVSDLSYELDVSLDSASARFRGAAVARFTLRAGEPADVVLDLDSATIESLTVGGVAVAAPYDGRALTLPAAALKPGPEEVRVVYTGLYAKDDGLSRFADPADGKTYVYSFLAGRGAGSLFPCFDQPDLKAPIALRVDAPESWLVASNQRESSSDPSSPGRRLWRFPPTRPLPPYLLALHAGEFAVSDSSTPAGVPLRLFVRASQRGRAAPAVWFSAARRGLEFFPKYLDVPYPYAKLDQILVPGLPAGAVETPGAVAYNEIMLKRARTREGREAVEHTILHELAHAWFGDLVTPAWWDELWLSESFAPFMDAVASEGDDLLSPNPDALLDSRRADGLREDTRAGAHALHADVPDAASAQPVYDPIVYDKGQAVVRQLALFVGEPVFREGLRRFLTARADRAATEDDLFAAFTSVASGSDLAGWRRTWLRVPGVNSLQARWTCSEGTLARAELVQSGEPPRPRVTAVAFYDAALRPLAMVQTVMKSASADLALPPDLACPALVLPNADGKDYAIVVLDDVSLKTALSSVDLAAPAQRARLWDALWRMTRSGRLPPSAYRDAALAKLKLETDPLVAEEVVNTIVGGGGDPGLLQLDPGARRAAFARLFRELREAARPRTELWHVWDEGLAALAVDSK